METTASSPRRSTSARWLRRSRNISACLLVCAPLVLSAWEVHVGQRIDVRFREVPLPERARDDAERALADRVAEYRRLRPGVIDLLLPEGRGGTRFYESLGEAAGMAFVGSTIVGLSASSSLGLWIGEVELHERGHLAHAFLPREVARLLARLPDPAPTELAADDAGQHFAEMAGTAWPFVAAFLMPPYGMDACLEPPDVAMLEDSERRVPGTAGFVARFLDVLRPVTGELDAAAALHDAARELSAPYRDELDALWSRIDARRRADGTFEPWAVESVRQHLDIQRTHLWHSDRLADNVVSVAYLPGLAVAALVGL